MGLFASLRFFAPLRELYSTTMSSKGYLFCLSILLVSTVPTFAKSWRGIEPAHSTSGDVERLLGPPNVEKSKFSWTYDFPEERAFIHFSSGEPCEEGLADGWKFPKDTVVYIEIYPGAESKWADVRTPGKDYEQARAAH